ncbi:MAG: glycoside hydrolase domain-containing protein, partial [Planctomycetota bacterium]
WATVGICKVQLVSPSGRGAIAYDKLLDDIIVSNASVLDTIAVKPGKYRDEFLWWNMTVTPEGITMGNPLEPLRPIRTVGPKGGTCSGQVVASSLSGFSGLQAKISPMVHTDGQTALPEEALSVRYAHQADYESFCNALSTRPADGKPVQPVWVLADIPRDQKSGWYTGTLRLTQGKSAWQVPVQILVSPWQVPDHKDNATLVSMYQSPETLADTYKVQPFSDEHFKLIEKSFQAMAKSGNDVLLVPVIVDTYLHHKNGLIRWVEKDGQLQPEYDAFKRYLDLHTKYFGKPKVVTLLVWKHDFGCRTWFRGQNNDDIKPIMVTKLDARTGKMTPVEAPLFGKPGSEAFWKSMIQGVRNILAERKIDDRYLLLGEVFDSRPLPYTVEFFKKIAPEMRWQGYAHWVREPKPVNGKFIAHGGVEVGFKIGPNGGGLPEFHKNWPEVGKQEYLIAQAERTTIHYDSSPLTYRSVMYGDRDGGGTIARIGLDFWPSMHDHRGRFRSRYQSPPKEGWLWRGHCPSLTSPGPDGAVITTRGQMFLEGLQETELAIQLMRAKVKASQQMTQRIEQAIARRHESWRVGAAMPQATISLDWLGLAAEEYVLAAQLAGNQAENLWNNPPAVKDE